MNRWISDDEVELTLGALIVYVLWAVAIVIGVWFLSSVFILAAE